MSLTWTHAPSRRSINMSAIRAASAWSGVVIIDA